MNLFKVSLYSAITQATSIIVGLVAVKILAVQIGPEGVALQSQFINSTIFFFILATGAINSGAIKYLSEYHYDKGLQLNVIRASLTICICCSAFFGLAMLIGSNLLSVKTLFTPQYRIAYVLYGLFLPITALNVVFSSFLNGLHEIKKLNVVNVLTSVINLVFLVLFSRSMHITGVLIYANFTSVFVFGLHIYFMRKYKWFSFRSLRFLFDKPLFLKLFAFSLMAIFAGFISPLSQIVVRNKLIADFGLAKAGEWQTVMRISDFYLSFLTGVLSVYLLPKLSSLSDRLEMRTEIYKTARLVIPIVIALTLTIWLARDLVIRILLTEKFAGIKELFNFQLLGDVFKIMGWGLSMILWAKAKTKMYLIVDSVSILIYLGLNIYFINMYGVMGATIGFCVSYIIYFFTMVVLNRKYL